MINPVDKITFIWWRDAYVCVGMDPQADSSELTISFGYLVKEDDKYVYLSHYYDGISKEFTDPYTVIPKPIIEKRKTVKV